MGVLNESFSYNPKTVKKETLKIDHLLKFACHAERTLMKGAWQAFSARKPKIKPRGPMTREEAVVVAVYRPGVRPRMMRYRETNTQHVYG